MRVCHAARPRPDRARTLQHFDPDAGRGVLRKLAALIQASMMEPPSSNR